MRVYRVGTSGLTDTGIFYARVHACIADAAAVTDTLMACIPFCARVCVYRHAVFLTVIPFETFCRCPLGQSCERVRDVSFRGMVRGCPLFEVSVKSLHVFLRG